MDVYFLYLIINIFLIIYYNSVEEETLSKVKERIYND